ncbi:sporulation protein YunB [uncultured Gemmiger sp.]|uniref:sporulation protein YunB n=1 Tax=uncultured Gemmiger sp. TaxID=1623490 RepID=UPI0025DAEB27|nr:sporulation protein YunB [uncultured Gemmiger sp.]
MAGITASAKEVCLLRRRCQRKPRPLRRCMISGFLTAALCVGTYLYIVQTSFKPTLEELAEYECRAIVVQAMNRAVNEEMETHPERYETLYNMDYTAGGELIAVHANTASLNQARSALIQAVETALSVLQETDLEIPYGSLTGITAFGGLGPSWKLTLLPDAYVEGTLREELHSLSINRTQYSITLDLQVTISMVLDGNTATAQVSDQIPVVSMLLNGDIPAYYAGTQ